MAEARDPLIGTTLGDYKLVSRIDEGGMGLVYLAEHVTLKNKTACKVLRKELLAQEEMIQRFLQEAKLVSQIRHPNLIDIFDIGELPDGRLYYVMEFLQGRSLATAMQDKRFDFAQIVAIGRQACAGLAAAHEKGIVHRDLKPDNIFLVERPGEAPLVKIVDFGIAKATGIGDEKTAQGQQITRTGYLLGTPQYMSPEQINGVNIDARSDLYSLGVILYEMCTGQPPFRGETLGQLLIAHLSQLPVLDPTKLGQGVPPMMEPILQKALAKDPKDRYESAQALAQDLERLVSGQSTEAATWYQERKTLLQTGQLSTVLASLGGQTVIGPSPRQRRIALALVGGSALLLATLGGVGGYLYSRRQQPSAQGQAKPTKRVVKRPSVDMVALRTDALRVVQEALGSTDTQPKVMALGALAATRDTRHFALISPKLDDPDPAVQLAAVQALGQLGARAGGAALLAKAEKTTSPALLAAIGEALDRLGDPAGWEVLGRVLKDKDQKAQLVAALVLEKRGDKKAAKLVDKRLKKPVADEDKPLILSTRARLGDRAAQDALVEEMKAMPAGLLQLRLAGALAKLNLEPAKALLSKASTAAGPAQVLAAGLLCQANEPAGLPLLRQSLQDAARPGPERLLAAEGLGSCGERQDAAALAGALKAEKSPLLRLADAGALLKLASGDPAVLAEQSLSWAQASLNDDNWAVRESAVALLGDADPAAAVPLLGQAIKDQRAEVRKSAAQALGRTKYKPALAVLSQAITDDSKDVRMNVLRSIGKVNTDLVKKGETGIDGELRSKVAAELAKRADTGDPTEQVVAAATLLRIGDDSRKDKLKDGLKAADPELRALAVEESAADPVLQKASLSDLLKDPDFAVRFKAACELADQGDKQSMPVLKEALGKGGTDGLRAFGLLKKMGETAAPPSNLAALLTHPDSAVRLALLDAAARLPQGELLPLLGKAAGDKEVPVRRRVVDLLTDFPAPTGTEAPPALAVAKGLANDSDPVVRQRAALIVAKLTPRAPDPPPIEVEEPVAPTTGGGGEGPSAPSPSKPEPSPDLATPPEVKTPDLAHPPDLAAPDLAARPPDLAVAAAAAGGDTGPEPGGGAEPVTSEKERQMKLRKALADADRYKISQEYDQLVSALDRAQKLEPTKNFSMQLGQAYELWAGEESGSKAKTLARKAIEAYKKAKSPAAKARIDALQEQYQ
ncbi:MAG: HEAT repeat domain-containing protein [Polyangia bacterium]